jgi:exo-beta-1,3-glucanase (GH17 family)
VLIIVYEDVKRFTKVNGKKVTVTDERYNRFSVSDEKQAEKIIEREKKKKQVRKITVGSKVVYRRN